MRLSLFMVPVAVGVVAGLGWIVLRNNPAPELPVVATDATRRHPQGDFYRSALPDIPTLNPFVTRDAVGLRYVLAFTHEPLVDRDIDGRLRGRAAETFGSDDGGKTWNFQLRKDLRFSDGKPVVRADVEFTLRAARDPRQSPKSDMGAILAGLAVAEVDDDLVVRLGSAEPNPNFALGVGSMVRIVQADHWLRAIRARAPNCEDWDDAFVQALDELREPGPGTGPYALALRPDGAIDWVEGSHLTLVTNQHGWQRAAEPESWNLAGMQLRFLAAAEARFAALRRGEIDWFSSASGDDLEALCAADPALAADYRVVTFDPPHYGHLQITWNCRRPPLDDARVRRAIGKLFDRATIARELMHGLAVPARGWFKPGMAEYPDASAETGYSIDEARALLQDAGYGNGGKPLRIEILCATEAPILRRIAELALPAFQEAGAELVPIPLEFATVYARMLAHDFEGLMITQYHDPVIDPHDFFAAADNDMGWIDADAETLLVDAQHDFDPASRARKYREFQRILAEQQPVTLLVHQRVQILLHRRFHGAEPGPFGLFPERFWVESAEQLVRASR